MQRLHTGSAKQQRWECVFVLVEVVLEIHWVCRMSHCVLKMEELRSGEILAVGSRQKLWCCRAVRLSNWQETNDPTARHRVFLLGMGAKCYKALVTA